MLTRGVEFDTIELFEQMLVMTVYAWSIVFMILRYVFVALLLAYLTNVYVKQRDVHTDIKGYVLEWRVDTYKDIHRWLMQFKSVIAAPSQNEEHYRELLSYTKFKIGYQGMEYASFFDTPEQLMRFADEFDRMLNKDESFIDDTLKCTLGDFQYWLDDVRGLLYAFVRTEYDNRWKNDEETVKNHCKLAHKVLGIALQKDIDRYFEEMDDQLRDRLRYIKISGKYTKAVKDMDEGKFKIYNNSQLQRNMSGVIIIFSLVHFEELFAQNPSIIKDKKQFMGLMSEYKDCYLKYFEEE